MSQPTLQGLRRKHKAWRIFEDAALRCYYAEPKGANCPKLIRASRLARIDHLLTTYPGRNPETLGWPDHVEHGVGHSASWEA